MGCCWKNLNHKRRGWKVPEEILRMASQLELGGAFAREMHGLAEDHRNHGAITTVGRDDFLSANLLRNTRTGFRLALPRALPKVGLVHPLREDERDIEHAVPHREQQGPLTVVSDFPGACP